MLKISDFSKLSLVSVKTLRYYDERGLLKPARVDPLTGYFQHTLLQPQMGSAFPSVLMIGGKDSHVRAKPVHPLQSMYQHHRREKKRKTHASFFLHQPENDPRSEDSKTNLHPCCVTQKSINSIARGTIAR